MTTKPLPLPVVVERTTSSCWLSRAVDPGVDAVSAAHDMKNCLLILTNLAQTIALEFGDNLEAAGHLKNAVEEICLAATYLDPRYKQKLTEISS